MIPGIMPVITGRREPFTAWEKTLTTTQVAGAGTIRIVIQPAELTGFGSSVRATLMGPSSGGISIGKAYVGHAAASGDVYDFDGNQQQLFFGGSPGGVWSGFTPVVSDWIDFSFDSARPLIFSYWVNAASYEARTSPGSNYAYYYKLGDDAATTNATGYTSAGNLLGSFTKLEAR